MKGKFDVNKVVSHWVKSSDHDFRTMNHLFKSKDYTWSLFLGHLVIEKLLKACYAKYNQKHPIFVHDLERLWTDSGIQLSTDQARILTEITTFNIGTRYDDYLRSFRKRCTLLYTKKWIKEIKALRKWIKAKQLK